MLFVGCKNQPPKEAPPVAAKPAPVAVAPKAISQPVVAPSPPLAPFACAGPWSTCSELPRPISGVKAAAAPAPAKNKGTTKASAKSGSAG
jgi:hypothetical protein